MLRLFVDIDIEFGVKGHVLNPAPVATERKRRFTIYKAVRSATGQNKSDKLSQPRKLCRRANIRNEIMKR